MKEDLRLIFRKISPFLNKWTQLPENYQEICEQASIEMDRQDFSAKGTLLTAWGTVSKP